jgi:hypothetical protein
MGLSIPDDGGSEHPWNVSFYKTTWHNVFEQFFIASIYAFLYYSTPSVGGTCVVMFVYSFPYWIKFQVVRKPKSMIKLWSEIFEVRFIFVYF